MAKTKMNAPKVSKINWLAFVIILINVAAAMGYIPKDVQVQIVAGANIAGPALIMTFRTWFTEKKES